MHAGKRLQRKQKIDTTVDTSEALTPSYSSGAVQCRFSTKNALRKEVASGSTVSKFNQTGIPDRLETGLENLSGYDLSPVRVHYNSLKPKQLGALAYAQGTNIHLGPGQERHLPHETWHVVQQMQGRVSPTVQARGIAINDDKRLEKEADDYGSRAETMGQDMSQNQTGFAPLNEPSHSYLLSTQAIHGDAIIQGEFFEKRDDEYVWHAEDPDNTYTGLAETRYYYSGGILNPFNAKYGKYPVYTQQSVDHSGKMIAAGMSESEQGSLVAIKEALAEEANAPYLDILHVLEQRILSKLGQAVVDQFYKGAHIVFEDGGAVYHDIFRRAAQGGIIKLRSQTIAEQESGTAVAATPTNLTNPTTPRGPGMGSRRPENKETSHYEPDVLPQLGIDFPGDLNGHILIGLIPNNPDKYGASAGDTFIQTEMYGFKSVYDHFVGHGIGWVRNATRALQTGLVGYTKHSEKTETEIREHDNPHRR